MIELSAQVAVVTQATKRLPWRADQRKAISEAVLTLQKLDNLRTKLLKSAGGSREWDESVADDLLDILRLEPRPVVKAYGDGKHAQVPQG
jgi:hypothetical protein